MLLTKEVEINIAKQGKNVKLLEDKGYKIPKVKDNNGKYVINKGTKIIIKSEDLSDGSGELVDVECDGCGKLLEGVVWNYYLKNIKKRGKYYCLKCAINLYGKEKQVKTNLRNNSKSFYDWCYEHLSKEEADNIIARWDYELNVDKEGNKLSPKDVSYGSKGINKKGYWFKCLEHPEHKAEQKNIKSFTSGQNGSIKCHQCNLIATTHQYLIKYLINKEDAYKYTSGSNKKIFLKCPDCGYKKEKSVYDLINKGLGCPKCSDGISYPEKFLFNVFEQLLNRDFETQLSKATFEWCDNYRYDFYINKLKCIIETHGLQHYEECKGSWATPLFRIQEDDKAKEILAKNNNIINYIILDCRKSELEWIKNSVMNSELLNLLNFKEEDIDWLKCHEYACSSLVKVVCDMWNSGIRSVMEITKELNIGKETVRLYLKQGVKLNWCDYNPKESLKNKDYAFKQVICLTTGEIYNSIKEASNKYNINNGISMCCRKVKKSAGKHPITGEPLRWMYYDEYILLNSSNIGGI